MAPRSWYVATRIGILAVFLLFSLILPLSAWRRHASSTTVQSIVPEQNRARHALDGLGPDPQVVTEWEELRRSAPGQLKVFWHQSFGTPLAIYGQIAATTRGSDPESAARGFLEERAPLFKRRLEDDLQVFRITNSLSGTHVHFQQRYLGIPVYGGIIGVHINRSGVIYAVVSSYVPDVKISSLSAAVDSEVVLEKMLAELEVENVPESFIFEPLRELVVYRKGSESYLSWRLMIPAKKPLGAWEAIWDAGSGLRITEIRDVSQSVEGTGRVFVTNAVSATGLTNMSDQNDSAAAVPGNAYTLRSLFNLDGSGFLDGDFVNTQPTPNRVNRPSNDFTDLDRSQTGFEEVEAYWAITTAQQYIQSLGLSGAVCNYSIPVNAHFTADDNSFYFPSANDQGVIGLGDGGVDDGEDADIIWHEYGHAMLDSQVPGPQIDPDGVSEGFSDYWAATMSAGQLISNHAQFDPLIGEWNNTPSFLRRVDTNLRYPEDRAADPHITGQIWSAALWQIHNSIGRNTANRIFLEGNFLLPPDPSLPIAAAAMLEADRAINGGAARQVMLDAFEARGLIITATYPAPGDPNAHHLEGGTRGFPTFPDGTPVEIGPGRLQRIRFTQPSLLDKPSRLLLTFKAGAPSTWELRAAMIRIDGTQTRTTLTRSQGVWSLDTEFGISVGATAPSPSEVKEVYLEVRDLRSSGGTRPYMFIADVVPQIRDAYTVNPSSGTTKTVRNLLPSNTVHLGTVLKQEVTTSAPVTQIEADFSTIDGAFNSANLQVAGPSIGASGAAYTLAYPLSYTPAGSTGAVTIRGITNVGTLSFASEDSSFVLNIGGGWSYVWDAGQLPEQAGWIKSTPGRPRPLTEITEPGILHVKLDGVDARLFYAFEAPFLQAAPMTVEFRVKQGPAGTAGATQGSGFTGGGKQFHLGFVINQDSAAVDKVGLDFVQEPFPPDQFTNIFMNTKDGFHTYRVTMDSALTVRLYVDGILRLQAQAGNSSAPTPQYGNSFFFSYEGFWDYVALRGGAALDPSALASPPTAP